MEPINQTEMNLALVRCLAQVSKTLQVLVLAIDHDQHPELADKAHAGLDDCIKAIDRSLELLEKSLP